MSECFRVVLFEKEKIAKMIAKISNPKIAKVLKPIVTNTVCVCLSHVVTQNRAVFCLSGFCLQRKKNCLPVISSRRCRPKCRPRFCFWRRSPTRIIGIIGYLPGCASTCRRVQRVYHQRRQCSKQRHCGLPRLPYRSRSFYYQHPQVDWRRFKTRSFA